MVIPNFAASFLTFRTDWNLKPSLTVSHKPPLTLNNARIQIESTCQISDRVSGLTTMYVLGASCKAEYVGVDKDIWIEPNADFCIILSEESFLTLKSWDRNNKGVMLYPPTLGEQPERQSGHVSVNFDSVKINLRNCPAERLDSDVAIINATLADEPLVGRCAFALHDRYDVEIDFPIKTMNATEREWRYQTDTGPILYPDLKAENGDWIESFHLAYIAYNRSDWAEFILQVPTPLNESVSVNHYSKVIQMETQNSTFRISPHATE